MVAQQKIRWFYTLAAHRYEGEWDERDVHTQTQTRSKIAKYFFYSRTKLEQRNTPWCARHWRLLKVYCANYSALRIHGTVSFLSLRPIGIQFHFDYAAWSRTQNGHIWRNYEASRIREKSPPNEIESRSRSHTQLSPLRAIMSQDNMDTENQQKLSTACGGVVHRTMNS